MRFKAVMTDWNILRDGRLATVWGVWDSLKGYYEMCGLVDYEAEWRAERLNRKHNRDPK